MDTLIQQAATILRQNELYENRKDIIKEFIGVDSGLTGLKDSELRELLRHLRTLQPQSIAPKSVQESSPINSDEHAADVMRKKIISMLRELGYEVYDTFKGRKVADMEKIYAFVLDKGYKKKGLNQYTYDELPKLVTQISNIYLSTIKKKRKNA
jgi:hypothetical protein